MLILPLTITQVDWQTYIEIVQKVIGKSPTRGLDTARIDIQEPSAFLSTLDLENSPLENLRKGYFKNTTFDHVSFSFVGIVDKEIILEISNRLPLKILTETSDNIQYLIILTGNMSDWYRTILIGCSHDVSKQCRILMNQCYVHFSNSGFKEVWSKHIRQQQSDKTFIFK